MSFDPIRMNSMTIAATAAAVAGGILKKGDDVLYCFLVAFTSKIASIQGPAGETGQAFPPQSVTILLEDKLDLSQW